MKVFIHAVVTLALWLVTAGPVPAGGRAAKGDQRNELRAKCVGQIPLNGAQRLSDGLQTHGLRL